MTRHLQPVPDPAEDVTYCLLCETLTGTYIDLCETCARVFSDLADRIANGVVADLTAGQLAAEAIPAGQLTLEEDDTDRLTAIELDDVKNAVWSDDFRGVSVDTLMRAFHHHPGEFSLADLRALRDAAGRLS